MAKGKKTGGRDFQKGNTFSKGSQKYTPEQKEIKRELEKINGKLLIAKYCLKNHNELKDFIKRKDVPCIDLMVARIVERTIAKAEINYLNWIYERLGWEYDDENKSNTKSIILNYKI